MSQILILAVARHLWRTKTRSAAGFLGFRRFLLLGLGLLRRLRLRTLGRLGAVGQDFRNPDQREFLAVTPAAARILAAALLEGDDLRAAGLLDDLASDRSASDEGRADRGRVAIDEHHDIVERHRKGQPVLVGTVSVEKSEELSNVLTRRGIRHEVLNAKHHEREAAIIARAGTLGAVTVSTNMAGRGTDIMLGGNPEFMADFEIQRRGISPVDNPAEYEAAWPAELAKQKAAVAQGHEEVIALGGLYVLGTERHESRRIDNQLRGRSGRQGDPGESRFYLSLQDDLMRRFNSTMVERFLTAAGIPDDQPIESKMVSNSIKSAQTQVEAQNFEIRKNVLKYDDVMNRQREVIYAERRSVLEGKDISEQVKRFLAETITAYTNAATSEGYAEDWDLDTLWAALGAIYPITFTVEDLEKEVGGRKGLDTDYIIAKVIDDAHAAYAKREEALTAPVMRELERKVLLSVLDRKWREHLYEMDYLQEGIGLRAMAQRDPLVEYQREGFDLFAAMMEGIKEEIAGFIFNVEVTVETEHVHGGGLDAPKPQQLSYSSAEEGATGEPSRNALCPCGSGKKYKRCHGAA